MKSFSLFRIWVLLAIALGATMIFAPTSRAQAEVAPDIYPRESAAAAAAHQTQPKARTSIHVSGASQENIETAHNSLVSKKDGAAATEPKRQP